MLRQRDMVDGLGAVPTCILSAVVPRQGDPAAPERGEDTTPFSCASGYAQVFTLPGTANDLNSVVRFDLRAELRGSVSHLCSAFLVGPGVSPAATGGGLKLFASVTGVQADSFHIYASTNNPRIRASVGLAASQCCAGYRIHVPAALLDIPSLASPPPQLINPPGGFSPAMLPGEGKYEVFTSVAAAGSWTPPNGFRPTHIEAAGVGSVDFTTPRGSAYSYSIATPETQHVFPRGNVVAAGFTWNGLSVLNIEGVR